MIMTSNNKKKINTKKKNESRKKEIGGPDGTETTRYGDWERKGICYDF